VMPKKTASPLLTAIRKPIYCLPSMENDAQQYLPLSPATLHVLLALTGGELHGYGIMLEAARQSGGQHKIGPGTLYDNLKKLLAVGLVEESRPENPKTGERRMFQLTTLGYGVLAAEVERLSGVLRHARRSLRLAERRP
jgi:DNA-binding PadR family transcriptional regulator